MLTQSKDSWILVNNLVQKTDSQQTLFAKSVDQHLKCTSYSLLRVTWMPVTCLLKQYFWHATDNLQSVNRWTIKIKCYPRLSKLLYLDIKLKMNTPKMLVLIPCWTRKLGASTVDQDWTRKFVWEQRWMLTTQNSEFYCSPSAWGFVLNPSDWCFSCPVSLFFSDVAALPHLSN